MNPMFKAPKANKVEFSLSSIQANPVQMKQLEGFIEEIVLWKSKVKTAQEGIADIRGQAKDTIGIPGKILMKLVRESISAGSTEAEMSDLETVQAITQAIEGSQP